MAAAIAVPDERPTLLDASASRRAGWRFTLGLVVPFLGVASLSLADWSSYEGPLRLAVVLAGTYTAYFLARRANRLDATEIFVHEGELRIQRFGTQGIQAPIGDIHRIVVDSNQRAGFLTIERHEKPPIYIGHYAISGTDPAAARRLVRGLRHKLPEDVEWFYGTRPKDPIEAQYFDAGYNLRPISMVPGVRYRYASPNALRGKIELSPTRMSEMVTASAWPFLLLTGVENVPAIILISLSAALLTSINFVAAFTRLSFAKSVYDKFMLTDEGLRVIREDKVWMTRRPCRSELRLGLREFDGQLIVLRNGPRPYFFDPRFLEEDVS